MPILPPKGKGSKESERSVEAGPTSRVPSKGQGWRLDEMSELSPDEGVDRGR